jgi:hypothetical protein
MKKTILFTSIMATLVFISCSNLATGPAFESKEGITKIIEQLTDEFGQKTSFERIVLAYNSSIGNSIIVNYNINKSRVIEERQFKSGVWENLDPDTMQIESRNPEDFLFSLSDFDLSIIPNIVADAKSRFITEKNAKDVLVGSASISLPTEVNDKKTDIRYHLLL